MSIGHRECQAGEGITNRIGTVAQGGRARNGGIFPIATMTLKFFDGLMDAFLSQDTSSSTVYIVKERKALDESRDDYLCLELVII